ncbi:hypothetical protein [Nocardioides sp. NPDC047086]|uniref:hypothetical protein n=1 Tax=Nocardioides sp. NPDC047086 TaxID=3154810 RepID=UPI0033EBBF87
MLTEVTRSTRASLAEFPEGSGCSPRYLGEHPDRRRSTTDVEQQHPTTTDHVSHRLGLGAAVVLVGAIAVLLALLTRRILARDVAVTA